MVATVFLFMAIPCWAQSKTKIVLDVSSQAAVWADMVSTEKFKYAESGERNPLAKPFLLMPKPVYYVTGTAMALSLVYLGNGMKKSKHKWERHVWFLPQLIQIAANTYCAVHNSVLLSQR